MALSRKDVEELKPWIDRTVEKFLGFNEPTLVTAAVSCLSNGYDKRKTTDKLSSLLDDAKAAKLSEQLFETIEDLKVKQKMKKKKEDDSADQRKTRFSEGVALSQPGQPSPGQLTAIQLRDLRHDNLATFIGACVDPPNVCIITEYCTRGSLTDILENEDVKLDAMFVASLVGDLVRGMVFLHECPLRSHGDLRSSNCLVDSRWVLKVADFGMSELKVGAEPPHGSSDLEAQCQRLLWRAPELLRDALAPLWGTQKGDVYSFGIILFEVLGRQGPYGRTSLLPSEMVRRVMWPEKQAVPFRPQLWDLPEREGTECVRDCMVDCWAEDPDARPDFKAIRTRLRPMRKGLKPNIFDNMLAMMEKYATNLEALVDERTDQLVQEKRKTEALLYEMLPRSVADQLRRGRQVTAESFESVTVYFSDIVGFTRMSAESTPFEVVDFLNDLYTCFDAIIEHYEVYKVETIGDAYMVVGGLPLRNGISHAAQVASMALHLLAEVRCFRIRHRPHDTLMLRVGIHSGPVCAGVVGRKMPRYCLFGDTVNTASRMESTGMREIFIS
ncbi:guanylate cyclase 32E [Ixodes scapularis]